MSDAPLGGVLTEQVQGHAEALDTCPWLCHAPTGPGTPFAWPVFFVVDSLRLLMMLGGAVLITISLWAIHQSTAQGQKTRFAGAIGLYIYVIGTEVEHMGDAPHWRFVVGLTCVPLLLWGYYRHLRHELPAETKPRQDPGP